MRILYLANQQLLSQHFFRAWKNAFEALGCQVDCLDYVHQSVSTYLSDASVDSNYGIIMSASNEGILSIPVNQINAIGAAVVINGLPFNSLRLSPDSQAPNASEEEVRHIAKFKRKLVWSQWMPEYVDYFYEGYRRLGISVISMPYAADITPWGIKVAAIKKPECDIVFIGNLKHRAKQNIPIFQSLFNLSSPERISVFGDKAWKEHFGKILGHVRYTDSRDELAQLYRNAKLSPNLHTARQLRDHIQLNDRVFQIAGFKAFQICDTNLVSEFYGSDEIPFTENVDHYISLAKEFILHPESRIPYIERAYDRTTLSHSWFNRIAQIYEALDIKEAVKIGEREWRPFRYSTTNENQRRVHFDRFIYYFFESNALRFGRSLKKFLMH
jgi:hypothetical protein